MGLDSVAVLRERAALVAETRAFFAARGVLEVDTPLLAAGVVVEANIDPIPCRVRLGPAGVVDRLLLASPEGPMKRLLAAGSGPIYQLAHAFRDGEVGRRHAVEFTMLEWYRPGIDHYALMDEVEDLVDVLLPRVAGARFERRTYRELFTSSVGVDPFSTSLSELAEACDRVGLDRPAGFSEGSIDDALDLLLVGHVEPQLRGAGPVFVHAYPPSQAALAKVRAGEGGAPPTADRFELYVDGVELANGYHELCEADEQRRRFEQANRDRLAAGRTALPLDEALLGALAAGLPPSSGVALGFDRLVMLALGVDSLDELRR